MADSKGASAFISDGTQVTGVDIRRCLSPLLVNTGTRAFGSRSGRRAGAGGAPTISGTTVTIPAGSAVVDPGAGNLDSAFLVSWGAAVPSIAGTPADSSQPRVDVVWVAVTEVLGSPTTQTITFGYQPGAASSSPSAPTSITVNGTPTPVAQVAVLGYVNVPASGGGAATVTAGPVVVAAGGILPVTGVGTDNANGTYVGQFRDIAARGLQRWNGTAWDDPDPRGEIACVTASATDATSGGASNPGIDVLTATVSVVAGRRYRISATVRGSQVTADGPIVRARISDTGTGWVAGDALAFYVTPLATGAPAFGDVWRRLQPSTTGVRTFALNVLATAGAFRIPDGAAQLLVEDLGAG